MICICTVLGNYNILDNKYMNIFSADTKTNWNDAVHHGELNVKLDEIYMLK